MVIHDRDATGSRSRANSPPAHGSLRSGPAWSGGKKDALEALPLLWGLDGQRLQHQEVLLEPLQPALQAQRASPARVGLEVKRGNGEGSIYRRQSDKLWIAAVTCPSGRRRVRSAHSKAMAVRKLEDLKREISAGIVESMGNPSVRTFLRHWIEDVAPGRVRPHTLLCYGYVDRWVSDTIGNVKLRELSRFDIQRAINAIAHMSPASIRTRHAGLRSALQYAVNEGWIAQNPASRIPLPKIPRREMQALTEEQLHRLIETTLDPSWRCLWALLGSTGIRVGEALGLRWSYVDLDRRTLQVVASLSRISGVWYLHPPKSARSRRLISLSRSATEHLRIRRRVQALDKLRCGPAWKNDRELVFTSPAGNPVYGTQASEILDRDIEAAGLPRIRVHDLRHTAATIALQRGIHPKVVQDMLGHSSIAVTLDVYSHTMPGLHQQLADAMDSVLGGSV